MRSGRIALCSLAAASLMLGYQAAPQVPRAPAALPVAPPLQGTGSIEGQVFSLKPVRL